MTARERTPVAGGVGHREGRIPLWRGTRLALPPPPAARPAAVTPRDGKAVQTRGAATLIGGAMKAPPIACGLRGRPALGGGEGGGLRHGRGAEGVQVVGLEGGALAGAVSAFRDLEHACMPDDIGGGVGAHAELRRLFWVRALHHSLENKPAQRGKYEWSRETTRSHRDRYRRIGSRPQLSCSWRL